MSKLMKRLLSWDTLIGLVVALSAFFFVGVPVLFFALRADPCFEVTSPCRSANHTFDFIAWGVIILFFGCWWLAAWASRWWRGKDD